MAAGAYLPALLGPHALNAHFKVTRQILFWFKAKDEAAHRQFAPDRCPVFIWQLQGQMVFYGFPPWAACPKG